ncbi:5-methylcytosine-specific restriction protein A [Paenibacillus sp. SORGH_AS306]|uniref:HNH endonuclease n=1 Tax=unclassified Paenibacillus TaxID=185978 RepID=UPI00278B993B|nr:MULTISPECIES: HNH endonuclease [unclassified Paenibacillus]MDQ1233338.1 5-methylcytosine-specific restriction protein A [Paenibacillus sp. SORGH_AS_0306]MDR6110379.1 5-methylcytosine-specific restriction protein A [Paenibacillus sp. SORGH_AS_0338]
MKEFAKKFYKSKAWEKCRQSYIVSVHGLCEICGAPGKIVHHKIYLTPENINNSMITLNHSNLQLHCQTCHNQEHHGNKEALEKGLIFDNYGNLIKNTDYLKE